jgi:futalosine hydrolase
MEIALVSATEKEIAPVTAYLEKHWIATSGSRFTRGSCTVTVLVTGIGGHRMGFVLGHYLASQTPDLCINAGIAGAFPGRGEIGEVVHVTREIIADLGAEDPEGRLLTPEEIALDEDISSVHDLVNTSAGQYAFLRPVLGISTQTAHGAGQSISDIVTRWEPDVETMEGGAFFYCCLKSHIPFLEIRAISNMVEVRDPSRWNVPLAVQNLSNELLRIFDFFVDR